MQLFYREYGTGKPVLILHGLFGQSDNWNTIARQMSAEGLRVFCVDQRNHGLSPHSDEWNYKVMAADVNELINEASLENPIIIGHSMGAKTALQFELDFPGVVNKYVIADMAAREYPPHHDEVIAGLNAVDFTTITTRKEAEEILQKKIPDFGTRQFLLKNIYWKGEQMDWRFNLKSITRNYPEIVKGVPAFSSGASALIVRGEKSNYVNENDIEDFRSRFANITIATIVDAGHWVHAEKPAEFYNEVMTFIKDQAA